MARLSVTSRGLAAAHRAIPTGNLIGTDGKVGGPGSLGLSIPATVIQNTGSDSYGRTQVQTPAGGLRDFLAARDAPWNAKFDGATDDSGALNNAQQAASALWLPPGTGLVTAPVNYKKSAQHIRGQGMYATTLQGGGAVSQLIGGGGYVSNVEISDLTIDGQNLGTLNRVIGALGFTLGRLTLRRVRFINAPTTVSMIDAGYVSELVIEDCVADGYGTGTGQFLTATNKDLELLIARRNRLRWLNSAFVLGTSNGAYQAHMEFSQNYIDLGWWLLKSLTSNSGGTVTYTATTVVDTAANFTGAGIAVNQTVRALTPRRTGTFTTITGNQIIDSAAAFVTNGVKRGEIVRSGTSFAVVNKVESNTSLHVEEWLDQTTYQPVQAPATNAAYTLYGLLLGTVSAVAATTLTVNVGGQAGWFDLAGVRSTPAAGTLYEVCAQPVYPIQIAATGDKALIEGNTVRRGWGDCISVFGGNAAIIGNFVEDGFDTGITCQGNGGGIVSGNIIRHCGAIGLGVFSATNESDLEIGPNQYVDNVWVNNSGNPAQVNIDGLTNGRVTGGRAYSTGEGANTKGLTLRGTPTGVKVSGFEAHGHTVGDIYVESTVAAGANELLDCSGNIVYQVTTNGQFTRRKGSGTPLAGLPASPGSQFNRIDGGAGTSFYIKESANDATGWVGK